MSGTSLDGLDLCYVQFENFSGNWRYKIIKSSTLEYPSNIKSNLANAQNMSALDYALFHSDYGLYLGSVVSSFVNENNIKPDYIASHGHTIFHRPDIRFTAQIGSGASIAAESGIDTICDFRTTDVAYYGQGAPLVPIGDKYLFSEYDYCLNLGGFSNISYDENGIRKAFDISPVNYVLNHYCRQIGKEYDDRGELASKGIINGDLLLRLNSLQFYNTIGPKSLGREWVESEVIPLIDSYNLKINDKLATFTEHIAVQITNKIHNGRVLVTGGGAYNSYLIERFRKNKPNILFEIPPKETIDFKEALIFAFLGALYLEDLPNCLPSVTGARKEVIGGALYKAAK